MKTSKLLKTLQYPALVVISVLIVASCESKPTKQTEDPAEVAAKENEIKFENKKQEKDAQFLVDATAFNLEQIRLARLGQLKGNVDVKGLSHMLMSEHEKSLKEATDLAKSKQVSIPDSVSVEAQTRYTELSEKSGVDFNKAFCERMVENHQKAVGFFEKESADSRDQDLKEWATTTLPHIRHHLDTIFACQKKLEKM